VRDPVRSKIFLNDSDALPVPLNVNQLPFNGIPDTAKARYQRAQSPVHVIDPAVSDGNPL
jgi:hypothetical protein